MQMRQFLLTQKVIKPYVISYSSFNMKTLRKSVLESWLRLFLVKCLISSWTTWSWKTQSILLAKAFTRGRNQYMKSWLVPKRLRNWKQLLKLRHNFFKEQKLHFSQRVALAQRHQRLRNLLLPIKDVLHKLSMQSSLILRLRLECRHLKRIKRAS